jgi:hypothetical protein
MTPRGLFVDFVWEILFMRHPPPKKKESCREGGGVMGESYFKK